MKRFIAVKERVESVGSIVFDSLVKERGCLGGRLLLLGLERNGACNNAAGRSTERRVESSRVFAGLWG